MRLANSYFMNKWPDPGKEIVTNIARPSHIWTRAVYCEGLMALYSIDPKKEYYDYAAVDWGAKHQWLPRNFGKNPNADDQCCGQTWIDLYGVDPRIERMGAIKITIDKMVQSDKDDDWTWIDALQMAMPVFTRLGVLYKDTSYFRKMYDLYHHTKTVQGGHGLYNPEEHLWWRDKDFTPPYKEPNGQNCYWSRGNGWVLAALVRVLSLLPAGDAHRPEYLQNYLDMVSALVPLQRADGFWNVSLHDSTHFGGKEVTGTALFTYGLAWGIRQGYLDKKTYDPVVMKAWNALVGEALHPDGMLGFVQGTGKEPKDGQPVGYDKVPDFEDFGLGCFLLAGSEVYQIATPPAANQDESKVPPYQEPTLTPTKAMDQRAAIYRSFEKNVYGRMPETKLPLTYTVTSTDDNAVEGLATKKLITIRFSARRHRRTPARRTLPSEDETTGTRIRRIQLHAPEYHRRRFAMAAQDDPLAGIWCGRRLVLGHRARSRRWLANGYPYPSRCCFADRTLRVERHRRLGMGPRAHRRLSAERPRCRYASPQRHRSLPSRQDRTLGRSRRFAVRHGRFQ